MVKSVLNKSTYLCVGVMLIGLLAFKAVPDASQLLAWGNHCLLRIFDPSADRLKKFELNLTPDCFLRLRKNYPNGKQEYFSFHLRNFDDLDYTGTTNAGWLKITTKADNIIVQTHNDRKGNIDTMATSLTIPVRNIEPEQVDSLRQVMLALRDSQVLGN